MKSTIDRRSFLRLSATGVAGAAVLATFPGCAARARRERVPIGMQLYSVRHELAEDFPGTIARLAEMGFEGVEFADYFGYSASELKQILDDNGLRCCGTHIYMHDMQGEALEETIDFNQTLGNEYLIVRWLDEDQRDTRESFLQTTEAFNEIAANLEPHGMKVGYHNHDYIFQRFDGEMLWDILAQNTRSDVVLQLDTGHAAGFGLDPVELIERHPGRTRTMHVKPYSSSDPAAFVGDDELDWPAIVGAAESVGGIEWYIVEYEVEGVPPLEALEQSLRSLQEVTA